ncbi:MAG: glycosyltransferase [Blastopirellula sp.]|nr:MAG: glycosyltransferase [Blastopirellula sp.]
MLTAVIPVYNEEESLDELHREMDAVAQENNYELEIIFIDDGSTDNSWQVIERLAEKDSRIRAIRFRKNFGKADALDAGFQQARGELIMTLDADLQDDPQEIPRFIEQIDSGLDVVSGFKQVRHDPWHKVGPSRVFNWMVSTLTGVKLHDHNCGMKCYRREIFKEVRLYGELHRFVPVLAASRGWKIGEIVITHRARKFGTSKYGVRRIIKGFLDLLTVKFLTGYGKRPQHLLGGFGLLFFSVGFLGLGFLSLWWVISRLAFENPIHHIELHKRAIFYYFIVSLLLGTQLVTVGLLAELVTANSGKDTKAYSISETLGEMNDNVK